MSALRRYPIIALLAALLSGVPAWADEPAAADAQAPSAAVQAAPAASAPNNNATYPAAAPSGAARPAGVVTGGSVTGMVSGLLFLLALVLGAAWLVRRTGGMPALHGGSALKVVAALSVGPRERVVLVELGGQQWLLGVASGAVTTLHHFEQPIARGGDDFAGKLRQFWPQGASK